MNSTLSNALDILVAGSIFCGMACAFTAIYASLRSFTVHARLLCLLKETAPAVHERLHSATWRTGINPWKAKTFLQSDELDEVPEIRRAKEDALRVERLLFKATRGVFALWVFGFAGRRFGRCAWLDRHPRGAIERRL